MKNKKRPTYGKHSPAMAAAKFIMLVLTAVYPLFMAVMTGAGLLCNRSSYGAKVTAMAAVLIVSGLAVTVGAVLALPRRRTLSIASALLTSTGFIACMAVLHRLSAHADSHGWQGSGRYSDLAVSDMYKSRLLPIVFPAAIALTIAVIQSLTCEKKQHD